MAPHTAGEQHAQLHVHASMAWRKRYCGSSAITPPVVLVIGNKLYTRGPLPTVTPPCSQADSLPYHYAARGHRAHSHAVACLRVVHPGAVAYLLRRYPPQHLRVSQGQLLCHVHGWKVVQTLPICHLSPLCPLRHKGFVLVLETVHIPHKFTFRHRFARC